MFQFNFKTYHTYRYFKKWGFNFCNTKENLSATVSFFIKLIETELYITLINLIREKLGVKCGVFWKNCFLWLSEHTKKVEINSNLKPYNQVDVIRPSYKLQFNLRFSGYLTEEIFHNLLLSKFFRFLCWPKNAFRSKFIVILTKFMSTIFTSFWNLRGASKKKLVIVKICPAEQELV